MHYASLRLVLLLLGGLVYCTCQANKAKLPYCDEVMDEEDFILRETTKTNLDNVQLLRYSPDPENPGISCVIDKGRGVQFRLEWIARISELFIRRTAFDFKLIRVSILRGDTAYECEHGYEGDYLFHFICQSEGTAAIYADALEIESDVPWIIDDKYQFELNVNSVAIVIGKEICRTFPQCEVPRIRTPPEVRGATWSYVDEELSDQVLYTCTNGLSTESILATYDAEIKDWIDVPQCDVQKPDSRAMLNDAITVEESSDGWFYLLAILFIVAVVAIAAFFIVRRRKARQREQDRLAKSSPGSAKRNACSSDPADARRQSLPMLPVPQPGKQSISKTHGGPTAPSITRTSADTIARQDDAIYEEVNDDSIQPTNEGTYIMMAYDEEAGSDNSQVVTNCGTR